MKKRGVLFAIGLLGALTLSGCTGGGSDEAAKTEDGRLKIVATIFPEYDWTVQILGDEAEKADLTLLSKNGVDIHSYQPTVDDMIRIAEADMVIYVGGESDQWVEDALESEANPNRQVIRLLDALGEDVKEEELVEGMKGHDEDGHHDDAHHGEDEEEETEYDEHVWLSLKNAQRSALKIAEVLAQIDTGHAKLYQSNAQAYCKKLEDLHTQYQEMTESAQYKTLLFGDRFPFRYLVEDYGLSYYAAFAGCEAEVEASFETVTFLAQKIDELRLPAILTITGSDKRIAGIIQSSTKEKSAKILTLDSMQSTTLAESKAGVTYLSLMEENLKVLRMAMNEGEE